MAAQSGLFTAEEPDAWLTSLRTASARGDYLFSINDYIVVASKERRKATEGPVGKRR